MSEAQKQYPRIIRDKEDDYWWVITWCRDKLTVHVVRKLWIEWEPDETGMSLGILYNLGYYSPCIFWDRLSRYEKAVVITVEFHYGPANSWETPTFILPADMELEDIYNFIREALYIAKNF
ncbi:MAG: hypothetical protein CBR30_09845 [Dictyoglomus sp. NZ13-RE01]|nr:MAG: hypothetical protein CBR30_09845 [Dictyoglomus sp. NZ13-RE01]